MKGKISITFLIFLHLFSNDALSQFNEALAAHGGLELFRQFGTAEFNQRGWPSGKDSTLNDHHLIDLKSRKILITSDRYKLGFDGKDVWILPANATVGAPPRFYVSTPFYFFGLPFLFADPGARKEAAGTKVLDGKEYDVVKITFEKGVGDTPEDYYIAYFDRKTHRLHLSLYIVTFPPFRQGKSIEQLDLHAIVYNDWQNVSGLLVPKKMTLHEWKKDRLGQAHASFRIENVVFRKERPKPQLFLKPDQAKVDRD